MSESKSNNDEMEHEGQLVAGSGTAEGYSREGSDADGRLSHMADPTRGAKASSLPPRSVLVSLSDMSRFKNVHTTT